MFKVWLLLQRYKPLLPIKQGTSNTTIILTSNSTKGPNPHIDFPILFSLHALFLTLTCPPHAPPQPDLCDCLQLCHSEAYLASSHPM